MPKKPKHETESPVVRPYLEGPLAEAIRYDTKRQGLKSPIDTVRVLLTRHYSDLGWLIVDDDGELAFRKPSPPPT